MQNAASNSEVISFHFGGSEPHADNVRKLQVFTRHPMKNKIIFRQNKYNFSRGRQGWNNILSIFHIR